MASSLPTLIKIIKAPASILTYIANSGRYCFNIKMIITAKNAIPIIFIISILPSIC